MTKEGKNILIFSSIATVLVVATIIWFFIQKSRLEEEKLEKEEAEKQQQAAAQASANIVKPTFNRNGELTNKLDQIKGRQLIAKSETTKVRSTPMVDNPTSFAPFDHNIIATLGKGATIGTVVGEVMGSESPKMRWIKVKLPNPVKVSVDNFGLDPIASVMQLFSDRVPGTYEYAFVRADVATFKQYNK